MTIWTPIIGKDGVRIAFLVGLARYGHRIADYAEVTYLFIFTYAHAVRLRCWSAFKHAVGIVSVVSADVTEFDWPPSATPMVCSFPERIYRLRGADGRRDAMQGATSAPYALRKWYVLFRKSPYTHSTYPSKSALVIKTYLWDTLDQPVYSLRISILLPSIPNKSLTRKNPSFRVEPQVGSVDQQTSHLMKCMSSA